MNHAVILPVLVAFAISVLLSPVIIPFLKKLKFGQYVRDDGPKAHLKKTGTPTMGGIVILFSVVITSLFYMYDKSGVMKKELSAVLFVTVAFGLIGFLDDYIKVVMKRSLGLKAWQKILLQLIVTGIFAYYLLFVMELGTKTLVPFTGGRYIDMGKFFVPFLFLAVLGTVNGVNLTDGLDGLASGVTVLAATFFTVAAIVTKSQIVSVTGAAAGSLLGFLIYNVYPARVFMGDTGSLALGGFVASAAFLLKMPWFIPIVGFIYVAESVSVILQVAYFKLTGGKRLLRMAPLHHHFELGGWSETRVVAVFSIITALLCLVGFLAM